MAEAQEFILGRRPFKLKSKGLPLSWPKSIELVMLAAIYLRKDTVYLPAMAKTEAGFYSGIKPATVVTVADTEAFANAIKETMARGNPIIPTPGRDSLPEPGVLILKHAKVKSWSASEKEASYWTVLEKAGIYQIILGRRHPDGGWEDDRERIETLPKGTTVEEVAKRVVALVQSSRRLIGAGSMGIVYQRCPSCRATEHAATTFSRPAPATARTPRRAAGRS